MSLSLDQIAEEASHLSRDAAVELVERILIGMHGGGDAGVELDWQKETRRRLAEIERGQVEGISAEAAFAQARHSLKS